MKVKTYEVPTEVLEACESRILKGGFEAKEIEAVAVESGAPKCIERDFIANRIADRLIQKHRKLKNIHIPGKWGVWQLLQTTPTNLTVDNPSKNEDATRMTETPETEAVAETRIVKGKPREIVDAHFARKLERERDEARKEAEAQKSELRELFDDLLSTIECASCVGGFDKFANEKRSVRKLLEFDKKHEIGVTSLNGSQL